MNTLLNLLHTAAYQAAVPVAVAVAVSVAVVLHHLATSCPAYRVAVLDCTLLQLLEHHLLMGM